MGLRIVSSAVGLLLFFMAGLAHAQSVLVANDDVFGVPFSGGLLVENPGVIKNDTFNGEKDFGGTAKLISIPSHGRVVCNTLPAENQTCINDSANPIQPWPNCLCEDGSFSYSIDDTTLTFPGTDSFEYQVLHPPATDTTNDTATVTLSACTVEATDPGTGDDTLFSCWKESTYRAKLTELGYGTFTESFEGAEWDGIRSSLNNPNSAAEITSQGITWTSNHPELPPENPITTSTGGAVTGTWGLYDPLHGYSPRLNSHCLPDNWDPLSLPEDCWKNDGFRGVIQSLGDPLHGVGAYIHGFDGASIELALFTTNFPPYPANAPFTDLATVKELDPEYVDEDKSGTISPGDTLTYTVTVINNGVATQNHVVVSDLSITPTGGTTPCVTLAPFNAIADPPETETCTLVGTYVVTQADVDTGWITNTGTGYSDETAPLDYTLVTRVPKMEVGFGQLTDTSYYFFGMIDATTEGFTGFEFRDRGGKAEQEQFLFGDNFIIATDATCGFATGYEIPASQWTKFALPCKKTGTDNYTVEEVFSVLTPADYGVTWGVVGRDSDAQSYTQLLKTDTMSEATGYWVFAEHDPSITHTVDVSGSNQSNDKIPLVGVSEGRDNYVGHTQNVSVGWDQVEVWEGNTKYTYELYDPFDGSKYACDSPVDTTKCLMSRKMWKWHSSNSAYVVSDENTLGSHGTLDPFDAVWVQAFRPGIELKIPAGAGFTEPATANLVPLASTAESQPQSVESTSSTGGASSEKSKKTKKPKKTKNEPWYIRLIATSGTMEDPGNVLGQMVTATQGNGPHDLEEPAPFGSRYLSILFTNPLFEEVDWGFTTDFRAMTKNPQGVWPFVVKAYAGISEVTISWQGEDYLFKDAWLVDELNGEMIRAKPGESYTFEIEGGEHHFRFEVGDD